MRQNGLKALLALLSAWFSSGAQASERAELAWQMVNEGALLIDVRTVEEYAQGHLDTALNWPLSEVETARLAPSRKSALSCSTAAVAIALVSLRNI